MLAVAPLKVALLPTPSRHLDSQIHAARARRGEHYTRRFSAVPKGYGPSGAHALEGAVRYAYPFDYQHEATTLLPNSDFLALPDHVTQYGPVRAQTLGLYIPDSIKEWLLSGAPRIYDRKDLELPGNRQIALPSILMRYFCSELTIQQFEALLIAKQAENDKELDVAATACRKMKRAKQTLALWALRLHLRPAYRILAVVVLLLQIVLVLLACILAPHQLSHPLLQGVRPPLLPLLAPSMPALS